MRMLNWTVQQTRDWYHAIDLILFLLVGPLFWGVVWAVFKLSAIGLAALLIPVSPNKNFALYTLAILALINCISLIIYYWTRDIAYTWRTSLMSLIITGFIIDFSLTILLVFSKKEQHGFETQQPGS